MHGSVTPDALAHASIPVPRGKLHTGAARLDIYLRATNEGRYRWFHADGTATVIDGESVDQAVRIAQMVWRDLQLFEQAQP